MPVSIIICLKVKFYLQSYIHQTPRVPFPQWSQFVARTRCDKSHFNKLCKGPLLSHKGSLASLPGQIANPFTLLRYEARSKVRGHVSPFSTNPISAQIFICIYTHKVSRFHHKLPFPRGIGHQSSRIAAPMLPVLLQILWLTLSIWREDTWWHFFYSYLDKTRYDGTSNTKVSFWIPLPTT
jgi:hypothetical protein